MNQIFGDAKGWRWQDMPEQTDKIVVITGTGGLAYDDALALTAKGATVILAGRSVDKADISIRKIKARMPEAKIYFEPLDLADLDSVEHFAERMAMDYERIDVLINNAGVMMPKERQMTKDGFELQFGTNYLGHFALTALLLPMLMKSEQARVISLSSLAHRSGHIDFDNLNAEDHYKPMEAYAQSKLACLMFGLELERRSKEKGYGIVSIVVHPGISSTNLFRHIIGDSTMGDVLNEAIGPFFFQPSYQGALPTLFAAMSPFALGGKYYGPDGKGERKGYPKEAEIKPQGLNEAVAMRLWEVSENLTGFTFE